MSRSKTLVQAVPAALFTYALVIGATYNGILSPEIRTLSMLVLTAAIIAWLAVRSAGGWHWHATPVDGAIFFLIAAILISLEFNPDSARRSVTGLWYVLLYIAVWYVLFDMLANGFLNREQLANAVLIGGTVLVAIGYLQLFVWLMAQVPVMASGSFRFAPPQLDSTLGDPGVLGGFLVVLIPLAVGVMLDRRGLGRLLAGLLAIASGVLLLLTYSRGAWGALLIAGALQLTIALWIKGLIDPQRFMRWWERQSRLVQSELTTTSLMSVLSLLLISFLVFYSLRGSTRSFGLRTNIYGSAITLFSERPLVGYGLFTFGHGLARLQSMPPYTPQNAAYSLPLHIGAELGLVGLAALVYFGYAGARAVVQNWRDVRRGERALLLGVIGSLMGFAIHQVIDMPMVVPAIALTGVLPLLIAATPRAPIRHTPWRGRAGAAVLALLWGGLLITGWWSTLIYLTYADILKLAERGESAFASATLMQEITAADPDMPVPYQQEGYLYGLAAAQGDTGALPLAIAAYERFVALEPENAIGRANLAALYRQSGDLQQAIGAQREAVDHAPDAWQFAFMLGSYLEDSGDDLGAWRAYRQALIDAPEIALLPSWQRTSLRQELARSARFGDFARAVQAWEQGSASRMRAIIETSDFRDLHDSGVYVVFALASLLEGNHDPAVGDLEAARVIARSPEQQAWVSFGEAQLALDEGDVVAAQVALERARTLLTPGAFDVDYAPGLNIPRYQFFMEALPRQFLPQVYFPTANPVLLALLDIEA